MRSLMLYFPAVIGGSLGVIAFALAVRQWFVWRRAAAQVDTLIVLRDALIDDAAPDATLDALPPLPPGLQARCLAAARAARAEPENHCANLLRFLGGELTTPDADVFRVHLLGCARCQREMPTTLQLDALVRGTGEPTYEQKECIRETLPPVAARRVSKGSESAPRNRQGGKRHAEH